MNKFFDPSQSSYEIVLIGKQEQNRNFMTEKDVMLCMNELKKPNNTYLNNFETLNNVLK